MEIPDWVWQGLVAGLAANAVWKAGTGVASLLWNNRQKIATKIRLTKAPGRHIRVQVTDTLGVTDRVSAEVTSTWNTHALVGSERKAIWNVEAGPRLIDRTLEIASWVLPDLVRHILR